MGISKERRRKFILTIPDALTQRFEQGGEMMSARELSRHASGHSSLVIVPSGSRHVLPLVTAKIATTVVLRIVAIKAVDGAVEGPRTARRVLAGEVERDASATELVWVVDSMQLNRDGRMRIAARECGFRIRVTTVVAWIVAIVVRRHAECRDDLGVVASL